MKLVLACLFLFTAVQLSVQPAFCAEPGAVGYRLLVNSQPEEAGRLPEPSYRGLSLEFDSDLVFYISPDDRVDIIGVMDKPGSTEKLAVTLLKRVRILAVKPSETNEGKSVVQFSLNVSEAQYLELASHSGSIRLALRKKRNVEDHPMQISSWEKIFNPDSVPYFRRTRDPKIDGEAVVERIGPLPAGLGADRAAFHAAVQARLPDTVPALSFLIAGDKAMFVRAGDRIDVLATRDVKKPGQQKAQKTTLTLFQNVLVLDARRSGFHPEKSILLLELNAVEAQYAALAWETADIQVLLRGNGDEEIYPVISPASLERLSR